MTEGGLAPWLKDFGLVESPVGGYAARTEANAYGSDGTRWFGKDTTPGCFATFEAMTRAAHTFLVVWPSMRPSEVVAWIEAHSVRTINVSGNRASPNSELGPRVEAYLVRVFRRLGHKGG